MTETYEVKINQRWEFKNKYYNLIGLVKDVEQIPYGFKVDFEIEKIIYPEEIPYNICEGNTYKCYIYPSLPVWRLKDNKEAGIE